MARRVDVILSEILTAINAAEAATKDHDLAGFGRDYFQQRGIERIIEIISEAVRHLPDELLATRPDLQWRSIRAIGNVIRHEYHRVDPEEIWTIVQRDMPALRQAIETMLAGIHKSSG